MRTHQAIRLLSASLLAAAGLIGPAAAQTAESYVAELAPVNADALGLSGSGTAEFSIDNGQLTITVDAEGLAPGIVHIQHYHGFPDGQDATCPAADADANDDGFVDLLETEATAGTTMVPFHQELLSLKVPSETYPETDAKGATHYENTVAVDELEQALQEKFGVAELVLDRRVVFIHGVPADTELPDTVQSLPDVPAHVTLPVVCGVIEQAE